MGDSGRIEDLHLDFDNRGRWRRRQQLDNLLLLLLPSKQTFFDSLKTALLGTCAGHALGRGYEHPSRREAVDWKRILGRFVVIATRVDGRNVAFIVGKG